MAERMAKLNGYKPYLYKQKKPDSSKHIQIKIIGLRPGEKMYEELFKTDHSFNTIHPRIMRTREKCIDLKITDKLINDLLKSVKVNNIKLMKETLKKFDGDFKLTNYQNDLTL